MFLNSLNYMYLFKLGSSIQHYFLSHDSFVYYFFYEYKRASNILCYFL